MEHSNLAIFEKFLPVPKNGLRFQNLIYFHYYMTTFTISVYQLVCINHFNAIQLVETNLTPSQHTRTKYSTRKTTLKTK